MATTRNSNKAATGGDTLTIACKLPQGLHIRSEEHGIDLKLHGAHSPYAVANHGMTRNVKASDWDAVKIVFADAKWLVNEFVFASTSPESATDKAEDRTDVRAGFEPLDPDALPKGIEGAATA